MAGGMLKPLNVSEKLVCEQRYKSTAECAFARARRQNNCPAALLRTRGDAEARWQRRWCRIYTGLEVNSSDEFSLLLVVTFAREIAIGS